MTVEYGFDDVHGGMADSSQVLSISEYDGVAV
jgi:hypothetical protein